MSPFFCVHRQTEGDLHDHAKHHEDVPESDKDPEVSQAEKELSDVVTC